MKPPLPTGPTFDRRRSGYVRDFNTLDVFVFNVFGYALGLALSTNPAFIGAFAPNAHLPTVLILGAALSVLNGLTYGWFGGIMPSTGGDYVFVGRGLSHRFGFITSWGFTLCQIYGLAMNIGWILSVAIAPGLVSIGVSLGSAEVVIAGTKLTDPMTVAIGSAVLLAGYFLAAYLELGLRKYVVYPLFFLALLGPALMIYVFLTSSHADFISAFNAFVVKYRTLISSPPLSSDAYDLAVSTASQAGIKFDSHLRFSQTLQAMPLGFLCFLGFTYSVYIGGEVREPQTSQVRGILAALGLGIVAFVAGMGLYVNVVGQEFHSAVGFPQVGSALGLPANSMNFFAGLLAQSNALNIALQLGNLVWFLLVPYVMLQVCTHNVVAWSCDRVVSQALLARNGPADAPWRAIGAVVLAAIACIVCNYFFGFTLVGAAALAAVAFFLTGLAAFYLPRNRPDVFAQAPPFLQREILGTTVFQLVGLLSALGFGWIIYSAIWYPEISGGSRARTAAVLAAVYISGFVVYELGRARLSKRVKAAGIDLDALFKEIPKD